MTNNHKITILALLFLIITTILFSLHPIPQDLNYHNFADTRTLFSIKNFTDVTSNIPYLLIGILGIFTTFKFKKTRTKFIDEIETLPFFIAFCGIFLIGLGSGYYHLNPSNETMVWDRLPITIGFMAFFAIMISERINLKLGLWLLPIFLGLGISSVIYWIHSEHLGRGDLRAYILVQFFPLLAIPLIMFLFPARYSKASYLGAAIFCYVIAKIFEFFDGQIFEMTNFFISGHTLKHLASAIATYELVLYIKFREKISSGLRESAQTSQFQAPSLIP